MAKGKRVDQNANEISAEILIRDQRNDDKFEKEISEIESVGRSTGGEADKDNQEDQGARMQVKGNDMGESDEDSQVQLVERKKARETGESDEDSQVQLVERKKKKEEGKKFPNKPIARNGGREEKEDNDSLSKIVLGTEQKSYSDEGAPPSKQEEATPKKDKKE